jgi:uncharacterized protein (TIGR03790 family)
MAGRFFIAAAVALLAAGTASAGGGPENVLLVVNANSHSSKTIANHWIRLRGIPSANVVYLDWKPLYNNCSGEDYVKGILEPTLEEIGRRKLDHQIDYIVFSSDFPWRVDLRDFLPDDPGRAARPLASLTGATYLWRLVQAKSEAVTSLVSNYYAGSGERQGVGEYAPTRAFRSRYPWNLKGAKVEEGGPQYVLSTMLAVTTGRGNSVPEAVRYLQRAALADATHPQGSVHFMKNADVRSKTRHDLFDEAAAELVRMGHNAEVQSGIVPQQKNDVLGLMTGTREFDLAAAGARLLPGAICDHLTSYGGIMQSDAHHTPLSEFLRHGAAGASGTVFEPLALQAKFPRPEMHVHYARGASLAEAFYQSVSSPYQLLIVGDPLCQPFAVRPRVHIGGVPSDHIVRGSVTLDAYATLPPGRALGRLELYVDGRLVDFLTADEPYELDTTPLGDGYHEIHVVAVDASPLEFQGRFVLPVWVDNHGGRITLAVESDTSIPSDGHVTVSASSRGASSILIVQHGRMVGQIEGDEGTIEIAAQSLGDGPVSLRAVGMGKRPVFSSPVWVQIGE